MASDDNTSAEQRAFYRSIYDLYRYLGDHEIRSALKYLVTSYSKTEYGWKAHKQDREQEANRRRSLQNFYEEKVFWSRRSSSLLAIGNAAGTLGVGSLLSNAHDLKIAAHQVWFPFVAFLIGTISSSITPFIKSRISDHKIKEIEQLLINDNDKWAGRKSAEADSAELFWSSIGMLSIQISAWCFIFAIISIITSIAKLGTS
jgi:hypothetical protein